MTLRTIDQTALELLCRHIPDAVIALDEQGQVCVFNPAAEAAFGLAADNVIGHAPDAHAALASLHDLIPRVQDGENPLRAAVTLPDGHTQWVQLIIVSLVQEPPNSVARNLVMGEMIHSLKGPLSAAKSAIDLTESLGTTEKQKEWARKARLSLMGMLNRIHQLEDMDWLETDGELKVSSVDLGFTAKRALIYLVPYAQAQGVDLIVEAPENGEGVSGDARRLENAIGNLVHNAIKYSPDGGPVTITITPEDTRVTVRVADQGIGIADDDLAHIFDVDFRAHNADDFDGSGMGLAIVKTIVEKHGGEVFVSSTLGEGSEFGFWLPIAPSAE
jgi:two-component system, OmpR family, phosphate regulon sensor histidine kinase PhoR